MATFFGIHDSHRSRREAVAAQVPDGLRVFNHLIPDCVETESWSWHWALAENWPHDVHRSRASAATVLLGQPHDSADGASLDAWTMGSKCGAPPTADGYYCLWHVDADGDAWIEADVLGLFPVYYWHGDGVTLVASSPDFMRAHPSFAMELDLRGLAGLLLAGGLVDNRSLLAGVRRLPANQRLFVPASGRPRLIDSPAPAASVHPDVPATEQEAAARLHALHEQFLKSALRHSRAPGQLLSGGIDSRILGGIACRLGHRPTGITFGQPGDFDAACAGTVAESLGIEQHLVETPPESYAAHVEASVTCEAIAGGLYAIPMGWNLAFASRKLPACDRLICGLTLDAVTGGIKSPVPTEDPPPLEQLRARKLGFTLDELNQLVADPALREAIVTASASLLAEFQSGGPTAGERVWRANLNLRHRYAVGACAPRYAMHAYPVLPALDRKLLALMPILPTAWTDRRRLQHRILREHYPDLARLPLDRNYFDTAPLIGSPGRSRFAGLRRRAARWTARIQTQMGRERRFYVRTMALHSPGWRLARLTIPSGLSGTAAELFDPAEVRHWLPPAGTPPGRGTDPIIDEAPLRNLAGIVAWLDRFDTAARSDRYLPSPEILQPAIA